jgi:hypothetical protein
MAVQRFVLNTSTLDDATTGLAGGATPAFKLDTSTLDSTAKLDGVDYLTLATGAAQLGAGQAAATSQTTKQATATAPLGAGQATATSSTTNAATATAQLGAGQATATSTTTLQATATANLGTIQATTQSTTQTNATGTAQLGPGQATATSQTFVVPTAIATLGTINAAATATVTPQPTPEPTTTQGGNPWWRKQLPTTKPTQKPQPPQEQIVEEFKPRETFGRATATAKLEATATASITWSILEDEADLLLLI